MPITLTITGESPAQIIAQLRVLASAASVAESETVPTSPGVVPEKRGPGRPRKSTESPAPAAQVVSQPAIVDEAGPEAQVVAHEVVAAPVAAPLDAPAVTKEDLQKVLVAIAQSGQDGRGKVSGLCQKYGAKNLSAIAPANYAALMTESRAVLAAIRESQGG